MILFHQTYIRSKKKKVTCNEKQIKKDGVAEGGLSGLLAGFQHLILVHEGLPGFPPQCSMRNPPTVIIRSPFMVSAALRQKGLSS